MTSTNRSPRVLVIGAGFGGLSVAAELLRRGHTDVTVLEKAGDVGGVWRENDYPGAACDVPSSLYSWSWAPNPEWPRRYSQQADILDYIRGVAERSGLRALVRTGVTVKHAAWDEEQGLWRVTTDTGEVHEAEVLVPALGQLSEPVVPVLPGAEEFTGPAFHSALWDHDVDLAGKRVAVIGTGASAIQFVPAIVDRVGSMTVFQRSAPYVLPKPDRAYTSLHTRAFERLPRTQRFGRRLTRVVSEQFNESLVEGGGWITRTQVKVWKAFLRRQVPDAALRDKLRPDYPIGCKRILFSNDWYPALAREHVDVVTEAVTGLTADGVVAADGTLHPADVVIFGTGFAATEFLRSIEVTGRDGTDLHQVWADGAFAHLGLTVSGFPNFFCVYGPNTNLGGSSIIQMLEAQAGYIGQAVDVLAGGHAALDLRPDVGKAYDAEMQERLAQSVWTGCGSWYADAAGRVTTNWPGTVAEYEERCAHLDLADFVSVPSSSDEAVTA
jgi:cation diffusion facilitator CzcD-associated flavoprotein CzcO